MKMRAVSILVTFLLQGVVLGHYMFSWLRINESKTHEFEYVRRVDEVEAQSKNTLHYPQFELGTLNETCGRGAWRYGKTTDTATVLAGNEIAFGVWESFIFHPGPGHVYLAKVPEGMEIGDFTGHDGDWFKIAYVGPRDDGDWGTHLMEEVRFTIPATTPPGKYLMRMEHLYLSDEIPARLQLYVNCAQISIEGRGGGKPTEFLKFPGSYVVGETRGTVLTKKQAGYYEEGKYIMPSDLLSYLPPGPDVWTG